MRIFQIAYDEERLYERARLLRQLGHEVLSVIGNESAMTMLRSWPHYDLFIIGHNAPDGTRLEMVGWLRLNYAKHPIIALNPPGYGKLDALRYNACVENPQEWLPLIAATSSAPPRGGGLVRF